VKSLASTLVEGPGLAEARREERAVRAAGVRRFGGLAVSRLSDEERQVSDGERQGRADFSHHCGSSSGLVS
jgi:hypothetical protein